ncbi:DUF1761 domain-containing protein [Defluviimonas aestuarii]|uniref:DUF1761 domain-containing protein n=1 Tax=Albidovulum aestuarii TaxID=1130726 RepID=UPI00249C0A3A|nr:DUF1761 domain-containing protein [Defluviimonas aestuarii]MDI3334961.1 DUF1761 domain-containing protein [Defluviimonas aestuarii]
MEPLNWPAVIVGTILAFGLGMLWFGPVFGKAWARGTHGIIPPDRPPLAAMTLQFAGTFLLALVIGTTAQTHALGTAIAVLLVVAILQLAGGLFSQKSVAAALIDGGYILAMGSIMILAQGLL